MPRLRYNWLDYPNGLKKSLNKKQQAAVDSGRVWAMAKERFAAIRRDINDPKQLELPLNITKQARSFELSQLIAAKDMSDHGSYSGKNKILGSLLHNNPTHFKIDSKLNSKYYGITHKASGFRIHVARKLIPNSIENPYDKPSSIKDITSVSA